MPTAIKSPASQADLAEIWVHIALDNLPAADRLIDRIDRALARLIEFPRLGRSRQELLPELRSYIVGNYILFYRMIPEGIELVRVLHGARDLKRELRRGPSSPGQGR